MDAPAVVMVHGLGVSSRYFAPFARLLARDLRLHLVDLPGFGRSGDPAETLDVPGMARGLASWMDAEGMPRASLVGNSLGCGAIVELAAREPRRVERALFVGPTPDPLSGPLRDAGRILLDAPRESPLLLLEHALDDLRAGPRRIWRTMRRSYAYPFLERAADVACPTLVVRGTRDPVVTRAWARRLVASMPDARYVEVEGPHALHYSAPERLVDVAGPFLSSSRSASFPTHRAGAVGDEASRLADASA